MKCSMCDTKEPLNKRTLKKHRYKECGLDNVILSGIKELSCRKCGEVYYGYGDEAELHKLIAYCLIKKDSVLLGKELRFLRKYLGYSGAVFSKLVGYESEHLSRLENGAAVVQEVFDRLVRLLVSKKMPDRDYDLQDLFLNDKLMKMEWLEFSMSPGKGWTFKEAA